MGSAGGRTRLRATAAIGGVFAVAACAVFWWLAVPRHEICGMTLPAPAGCGSGRVRVAAVWSVVVAGFYVVMVLSAARRRRPWIVGIVGLVVGIVWGFKSVLYA